MYHLKSIEEINKLVDRYSSGNRNSDFVSFYSYYIPSSFFRNIVSERPEIIEHYINLKQILEHHPKNLRRDIYRRDLFSNYYTSSPSILVLGDPNEDEPRTIPYKEYLQLPVYVSVWKHECRPENFTFQDNSKDIKLVLYDKLESFNLGYEAIVKWKGKEIIIAKRESRPPNYEYAKYGCDHW